MKSKYLTPTLVILFSFNVLFSQSTKNYWVEHKAIKFENFSNIKNSLSFIEEKPKISKALTPAFVISTVLPILIKNVPKLFYKPENYIKEYGTDESFIRSKTELGTLDGIKQIHFIRKGDNAAGKSEELTSLKFQLNDVKDKPRYKTISLSSFSFNYTPVKLRSRHKSINAVIEVTITYFDGQNHKQAIKLKPISIKEITPKCSGVLVKDNIQIIPPIHTIESFQIRITEVNTRKKDWDNWLEIYNKNQDKLKDYLLEVISN